MNTWPEGDRLVGVTYRWLEEKYKALGSPLFVTCDQCRTLEDSINVVPMGDAMQMKSACKTFAAHMVGHFRAARVARRAEPARRPGEAS
jgi:hypothetical protein